MVSEKSTIEELLTYADKVIKNRGDLLFIKIDGERERKHMTVSISYPSDLQRAQIRCDDDDLRIALFEAIEQYILDNGL